MDRLKKPVAVVLAAWLTGSGAMAAERANKRSPLNQKGSALGSGKQLGSGPGLTPEKKAPPVKAAPTPKAPPPPALTPKPDSVMAPGPALTPVKKAPPVKIDPPVKAQSPQTPVTKPGNATTPGPALTPVKQTPPVTAPPQTPKPVDLNSSAVLGGKQLGSVTPPKQAPPVTVPPQTPKPVDLNSSAVLGGKQLGSVVPPKQTPPAPVTPETPKPVDFYSSEVLGGKQLGSSEVLSPEGKLGEDHFSQSMAGKLLAYKAAPYAKLSAAIYYSVNASAVLPSGWKVDARFDVSDDASGFRARTYKGEDGKIAVVFQGSDGGLGKAIKEVLRLAPAGATADWFKNNLPQHLIGMETGQYERARKYVQDVINSGVDPHRIVVTGHSLGGGLAQYAASMATLRGSREPAKIGAYTFNADGLGLMNLIRIWHEGGKGDIINIYAGEDPLRFFNVLTPVTGNVGKRVVYGSERGGSGGHSIDALADDLSRLADQFERSHDFDKAHLARSLRDKARWEMARDMIFEGREYAYNVSLKTGDYQLAKSVVDVHGNRVRIEAYVLRPAPNQVQQLVLNAREKRLDYGYWLSTYFRNVSGLEEAKTATRNTFYSRTMPSNYLTRQETFMTNTVDGIRATVVLGAPAALNFGTAVLFYPSTINTTLRLTGPGYDNIKETVALTHNGNQFTYRLQYPNAANVMADYLNLTYTPSTGVCVSCGAIAAAAPTVTRGPTTAPAGGSSTRYTFKNGTFLRLEGWWVTNDGKVSAPPGSASLSGNPSNMLKNLNLEARYTATEFNGGNIDLVVPGEVFSANNSSSRNVSEP